MGNAPSKAVDKAKDTASSGINTVSKIVAGGSGGSNPAPSSDPLSAVTDLFKFRRC